MAKGRKHATWKSGIAALALLSLALVVAVLPLGVQPLEGGVKGGPDAGPYGAGAASEAVEGTEAGASTSSFNPQADDSTAETLANETSEYDELPAWYNGAHYREGEVLAYVTRNDEAGALDEGFAELGYGEVEVVDESDNGVLVRLAVPDGKSVASAVSELRDSGLADDAQPNFAYHLLDAESNAVRQEKGTAGSSRAAAISGSASNAPLKAQGLQQAGSWLWHLNCIGAFDAWRNAKTQHSVTVAIVDTGCNVSHPDLRQNIVAPYNTLNDSSDVTDFSGHGTHVAGIVSAVPDNGIGVDGVSYNARIMPVKVMDDDTADTVHLVKAYSYIVENAARFNVRVVNMSLGAEQYSISTYDAAVIRASDKAYRAGVLSVFAAGNEGDRAPYYCFPCDYSETGVGVISLNQNYAAGMPDSSSNYNVENEKTKDISAPGDLITSTASNGGYAVMSGTSMATPVVAGVAALVYAANPSLGAGEVKSVLSSTAQDLVRATPWGTENIGFDERTGYGLVKADAAVLGAANSYIMGNDGIAVGGSSQLSVPRPGSWRWSSDEPSVASVDANSGLVRGLSAGEASISATDGQTTLRRTVVVYSVKMKGASAVVVKKKTTLKAQSSPVSVWTYSSSKPKVASVGSTSGVVKGKKVGTTVITATLSGAPNVKIRKTVKVIAKKKANPMSVKAKTKSVKYKNVKKKARKITGCIAFKKKAKGTVTYSKVSKGSSKRLSINKKTGAITVKKGTKKGTYKIKVKVKAAGTSVYKSASKTVTVKVKVK